MIQSKREIRRYIWRLLEERDIAVFPRPVYGRIPNFRGADRAAFRLLDIKEFVDASVVKVNPDSPQKHVRRLVLKMDKTLIMPTPRIKKGFLIVKPDNITDYEYASTIKGAFKYGRYIHPSEMPEIDFIVEGSVAVSRECDRIGKGEGYGELEYAILLEYGKIDYNVPIATTVHDMQIVDYIPRDPFDVSINYIVTPTRIIRCGGSIHRPRGIIWDSIDRHKIMEIPILYELARRHGII